MCDAPANITSAMLFRDPGHLHTAVVPGLNPGALYFYRVGARGGVMGEELSFRAPLPGAPQGCSYPTWHQRTREVFEGSGHTRGWGSPPKPAVRPKAAGSISRSFTKRFKLLR